MSPRKYKGLNAKGEHSWEPRVRPQIQVTKAFADEHFDGTFRLTLKLANETEPCEIAHVYEPVEQNK